MHQFADEDENFVYENVRNGTRYWGGTFELKILANLLKRAIVSIDTHTNETSVHTPDLTQAASAVVDDDMMATYDRLSAASEPPIYLLYSPQLGAQHYAAIIIRQERQPDTNTTTEAGTGAGLSHSANSLSSRKKYTLDDTESEEDTDTENKLQHNRKRNKPKTGQHRKKKKRKK